MKYRNAIGDKEEGLLERFQFASQHFYKADWHPKLSVRLWESAFVTCFSIDIAIRVNETGCWVDWSLRHGKPMICSYQDWFTKLQHPDKAKVQERMNR